jgi:CheY-like chemotaxis protein
MNLVVNARDAMPDGGELRIATDCGMIEDSNTRPRADVSGEYMVLSITDTGCGMDAATKARIFEPFFTTKEKGKGTGLGLSIVYSMVQQSNGFLTVQSEPGRGATFHIHLPCVKKLQKTAEGADAVRLHPGTGKILLVEDEDAIRKLAHQMLARAGYTVLASSDGAGALQLSRVELDSIDLLITDVVMPGMSGPELSARLVKRQPALKVLYLSGYTDHPRIRAGSLSDRQGFLQKPFTQDQLLVKVQNVLRGEMHAA